MRRALVVVIAIGLAASACTASGKSESLSVTITEPSAGKVALSAPVRIKAGRVEMTLKNAGNQVHDAQLIRVEGSHPIEQVLDVISVDGAPIPSWLHAEGGVFSVAAGKSQSATMILTEGQHYIVDTNTDADNNAFAQQGGVKTFMVTAGNGSATLPSAGTTITAREYAFGVPANLKAGTTTLAFRNEGRELHLLVAALIEPGKTIDDVRKAFSSQDQTASPPADFDNAVGVETIDAGKSLVTKVTLRKGTYAFVCFVSDRTGGPPHFALGMLQAVKVN